MTQTDAEGRAAATVPVWGIYEIALTAAQSAPRYGVALPGKPHMALRIRRTGQR